MYFSEDRFSAFIAGEGTPIPAYEQQLDQLLTELGTADRLVNVELGATHGGHPLFGIGDELERLLGEGAAIDLQQLTEKLSGMLTQALRFRLE